MSDTSQFLIILIYLCTTENALFWGQIFEMEILMDLHFFRSSEFKNHIVKGWSVCGRVLSSKLKNLLSQKFHIRYFIFTSHVDDT